MKYAIICKLKNGSTIPAFAETFNSAKQIAEMLMGGDYTSSVEIITLATGARTRYVY